MAGQSWVPSCSFLLKERLFPKHPLPLDFPIPEPITDGEVGGPPQVSQTQGWEAVDT